MIKHKIPWLLMGFRGDCHGSELLPIITIPGIVCTPLKGLLVCNRLWKNRETSFLSS